MLMARRRREALVALAQVAIGDERFHRAEIRFALVARIGRKGNRTAHSLYAQRPTVRRVPFSHR